MYTDQRRRVITPVIGESRTKQSFKDECDIHRILAKYAKTGLLTHTNRYNGRYEALPSDFDYQEALNHVLAAEDAFASLPSAIRNRFGHDPAEFLKFVADPKNAEELVTLGLANPPSPPPRAGAPSPAEPEAPPSSAPTEPPAKQKS